MMRIDSFARRLARLGALLLLATAGVLLHAPAAMAQANPSCNSGPTANISLPSTVLVPSNTPVGTLLGSPVSVTASFSCSGIPNVPASSGGTNAAGIQVFNLSPSQLYPAVAPSSASTNINVLTYATSVPGIGLRITINPGMRGYDVTPGDQQANAYMVGNANADSNGNGNLSVSYTAQLIVIANNGGTVSYGSISGTTLLTYYWYVRACQAAPGGCNGHQVSQAFGTTLSLSSGTTITMPTCSVDAGSANIAVTLPTIGTNALTGTNSTSSPTSFGITLNCQAGANVSITLSTSRQWSNAGVIKPTAGGSYASNVGVQLLDQNQNPVQWNASQAIGSVSNGPITIPYYAQYYQTGASVGAGKVSGQATFTTNYQ